MFYFCGEEHWRDKPPQPQTQESALRAGRPFNVCTPCWQMSALRAGRPLKVSALRAGRQISTRRNWPSGTQKHAGTLCRLLRQWACRHAVQTLATMGLPARSADSCGYTWAPPAAGPGSLPASPAPYKIAFQPCKSTAHLPARPRAENQHRPMGRHCSAQQLARGDSSTSKDSPRTHASRFLLKRQVGLQFELLDQRRAMAVSMQETPAGHID